MGEEPSDEGPAAVRLSDIREAEQIRVDHAAAFGGKVSSPAEPSPNLSGRRRSHLARRRIEPRLRRRVSRKRAAPGPSPANLISVIVTDSAPYDAAGLVTSLQAQTVPDWELLLPENCGYTPVDETRVRLVHPTQGDRTARGDTVIFVAGQTTLAPTCLEKVSILLTRFPGVDCIRDASGRPLAHRVASLQRRSPAPHSLLLGETLTVGGPHADHNQSETNGELPATEDLDRLRKAIADQPPYWPEPAKPALVILMAWLVKGGGAETFLLSVIPALRRHFDVVVVATSKRPDGFSSATDDFLRVTPFVFDLDSLVGQGALGHMVVSLLNRLHRPRLLLIGSLWAFHHLKDLRILAPELEKVVVLEFNHRTHVPFILGEIDSIDVLLVAHRHLQSLFRDYYRLEKPVELLYIAPPEVDRASRQGPPDETGTLRIGWLGRNSPEKRPDLVADIAERIPRAEFLMGISGSQQLPQMPRNVKVLGFVEDGAEFMAGIDILLNTSDLEGISMSAMEALRSGVPVATRDVGGMSELIRDGENGIVYDARDLDALVARLRDRAGLERLRERASHERLPESFRYATMVEELSRHLS